MLAFLTSPGNYRLPLSMHYGMFRDQIMLALWLDEAFGNGTFLPLWSYKGTGDLAGV